MRKYSISGDNTYEFVTKLELMIQTVIIDDEQDCINRLLDLLQTRYHNLAEVTAIYKSVEDGLEGIKSMEPDLVFLDVILGDKNGFDILKQLEHYNFGLILTTACKQYALEAFKFSALDYLMKPIDAEDFEQAMQKVFNHHSVISLTNRIELLIHNLEDKIVYAKKIAIPTLDGYLFIDVNDIVRCQADINYTMLYLTNGQTLLVSKPLKDFEEMLCNYQFSRVHNSHLINLKHIKCYNKGKGGFVIMKDNSEIEVSTRRKRNFLKLLMNI